MIQYLLFFIIVLWTILFRHKRSRMYKLASRFPSYGEIPVLGIAHHFIGSTQRIMSSVITLSEKCTQNGGLLRGWLGHILYILITNPVDLEKILRACPEKDQSYRFLRELTGYGVIFAPVPVWRSRRKIMVPVLSHKVVERFLDVIVNQSNTLVSKLNPMCGTGQFDVMSYVNRFTFDSMCELTLGVKVNAQDDPNLSFMTAFNRLTGIMTERIFKIWLQPNWTFKLFRKKYTDYEKSRQLILQDIDEIILRNKQKIEKDLKESSDADWNCDLLDEKSKTFLDLLIKSSGGVNGYNEVELGEEILTMIVAGTDTSAIIISNTLLLLRKYPKIQDKVHEEIDKIFQNTSRPIVKEDLTNLIYLERVIKESMRLLPPVPFIARKVEDETKLPSGYVLPANSGVLVCIWSVHRNPEYWGPDAECFDPDRFLPERLNLPHACCYMPFSFGPRNCIGSHLGIISVKTALATILRFYRVVGKPEDGPIPQVKLDLSVTLKLIDGWQLALESKL